MKVASVRETDAPSPKTPYMFEVFKGKSIDSPFGLAQVKHAYDLARAADQWYWRLRASNGKIVADGSEGYSSKAKARAAVRRVWMNLIGWRVLTVKV